MSYGAPSDTALELLARFVVDAIGGVRPMQSEFVLMLRGYSPALMRRAYPYHCPVCRSRCKRGRQYARHMRAHWRAQHCRLAETSGGVAVVWYDVPARGGSRR